MSDLIKNLKDYGADIDGTMERFLDDVELYETCFDSFIYDEAFEGLK